MREALTMAGYYKIVKAQDGSPYRWANLHLGEVHHLLSWEDIPKVSRIATEIEKDIRFLYKQHSLYHYSQIRRDCVERVDPEIDLSS